MATTRWILGAIVGVALGIGAGAHANNRVAIGGSEDEAVPMCKLDSDCSSNASCSSGKCKSRKSNKLVDGESCSYDSDCDSNSCMYSKCKATDGKGDKGAPCKYDSECKSGSCSYQKCT